MYVSPDGCARRGIWEDAYRRSRRRVLLGALLARPLEGLLRPLSVVRGGSEAGWEVGGSGQVGWLGRSGSIVGRGCIRYAVSLIVVKNVKSGRD